MKHTAYILLLKQRSTLSSGMLCLVKEQELRLPIIVVFLLDFTNSPACDSVS